ncbi:MAG: 4Fe-4S dicluster domain-containing protein [Thermococcus sp.]|nr:4Fe-4S dicluster domain-containing protein [Thermococcus sp.]
MLKIEDCIGCGLCARACPFNAITVVDNSVRKIIFEPEKCGSCHFECNEACPVGAIEEVPDKAVLTFEYAHCRDCGKRLSHTLKEVEYAASKLREAKGEAEFAYLCDDCKRRRIFEVAWSYGAYVR